MADGGLMFGRRILILVPHPDDEVVGCAAAIGRAKAQGAEIFALYLTHGCIARETLWPWQRRHYERHVARRQAEGRLVAGLLGITPVGWSARPARHLWRHLPEVYEEIRRAIAAHDIDQLWVPAFEGGNADHDAANAVASLLVGSEDRSNSSPLAGEVRWGGHPQSHESDLIDRTGPHAPSPSPSREGRGTVSVLEFAEYNFSGGRAHSQEFPARNGGEQVIELTPKEHAAKAAALRLYVSERQNLNYVKCGRECFRPLPAHDYSRPAHPGTLWYARFQWVPFRHPRVDFTQPQEVADAIMHFLKERRK